MADNNDFVFRKGKKGDRPPAGYIALDENDFPAFVLDVVGKQVGAACVMGAENHIYMISSFERNKGYCTKFLQLWEDYLKERGYSELVVSHVASDALEYILEVKLKDYSFSKDEHNEKTYRKKLTQSDS